ncbi:MAG: ABC transporter permease [Austwickia sp.]|nr:ABC transporter permease [Austwickia sp.]
MTTSTHHPTTVATHPGPGRTSAARSASATAVPTGGRLSLLGAQILAELRQNWRVPEYAIGVLAVPVILYAMFGLTNAGRLLPEGTDVGAVLIGSFAAYGVVSLAIFTFGVDVAQERGSGWLRRLRSTPMPMWAYFAAKITMALVFSALIIAGVTLLAVLAGGVPVEAARMARVSLLLLAGTVAFSTMGFAMAFWFRPKAASAIGNLTFLPLSFVSGFFQPLGSLPQFLQDAAPWLPTYHFGALVWSELAPARDVAAMTGAASGPMTGHILWVVGTFVVFGALAIAGYRRDAQREKA